MVYVVCMCLQFIYYYYYYRILNGNAISTVYPGNLSFYPVLDYLDLSDNLISIIPADLETEPLVITEL